MPGVTMDVQHKLAVGQVTPAALPPGTVIEWMALRRAGPEVVRNIRWDGGSPAGLRVYRRRPQRNLYLLCARDLRQPVARRSPAQSGSRPTGRGGPARGGGRGGAGGPACGRGGGSRAGAPRGRAGNRRASARRGCTGDGRAGADCGCRGARARSARPSRPRHLRRQAAAAGITDTALAAHLMVSVPALFDSLLGVKGGVAVTLTEHVAFAPGSGRGGESRRTRAHVAVRRRRGGLPVRPGRLCRHGRDCPGSHAPRPRHGGHTPDRRGARVEE